MRAPTYKVVVLETKKGIKSKPIDTLGFYKVMYNSPANESFLVIDKDKLALWIFYGAKFSRGLERLLLKV